MARKIQACVLHNRETNWDIFRKQVGITLNTQMSLKNQDNIIVRIFAAYRAKPENRDHKLGSSESLTIFFGILELKIISGNINS